MPRGDGATTEVDAAGSTSAPAPKEPIRAHFDGLLQQQIQALSAKLRFLGGEVVGSVNECTHLVVPNLERSLKLLEALALGKDVVSPQWIQQSYSLFKLIDSLDFYVYDAENERRYAFSLKNTILRARQRRVFQDVTFHLSDSVKPSFEILSRLISAAGGVVQKGRPSRGHLARCIENDSTYLLVVSRNDLHHYRYLTACNFPLFNEEFVLMSILRHEIEPSLHYRVFPPSRPPHIISSNGTAAPPKSCGQPTVVKAMEADICKKENSVH